MATLIALVAAFGLVTATAAPAAVKLGTYSTQGCTGAPTWRIGYRLYQRDSAGRTTSSDATPAVLDQLRLFADAVGHDSACGIRVHVDAFDMQDAAWPASPNSSRKPADTASFAAAGPYDSTFNRFPANNEDYCANTSGAATGGFARFPVDADGRLGCVAGGPDCLCEPWELLLLHEWLHQVVAFYRPRLGWPAADVHGACEHGYSESNCHTYEPYFSDIMQGRVPVAGGSAGIQPDEWALQGTPTQPGGPPRPAGAVAATSVSSDATGTVQVDVPADLGGPVSVRLQNPDTHEYAMEATVDPPLYRFGVADGSWLVCLSFAGSPAYERFGRCEPVVVKRIEAPPRAPADPAAAASPPAGPPRPPGLTPSLGVPFRPAVLDDVQGGRSTQRQAAKPRPRFLSLRQSDRSVRAAARRTGAEPLVLVARRGSAIRVIRGTAQSTLVRFSATFSKGSWRLRLRSGRPGRSPGYSAVRVLRIR